MRFGILFTRFRFSSGGPGMPALMRPRIVIIGAGFGGFAAARGAPALRCRRGADRSHQLPSVSTAAYQVATAALSPADIATATRSLLRRQANVTVIMGEVIGIDSQSQRVKIAATADLDYDFLIIATGAAYSFFGHEEWRRYSRAIKSLEDAIAIRSSLLGAFEWAESRTTPGEIGRLLTFVVVGGAGQPVWNWPVTLPSCRARHWRETSGASSPLWRVSSCSRRAPHC